MEYGQTAYNRSVCAAPAVAGLASTKTQSGYNQAIRLDPNDASAYNNRGTAYHRKSDRSRACADWSKALELDPNNTMARNNLANFK
jgi:Flp pilus assembly protein TadD